MYNKRGKTLTIFIALIMILLVSSTSIGFFLYHKEAQTRKEVESDLDASRNAETKLQTDLKEVKHQLAIAQDKAKEADDKINNLIDESELNDGLRKELKTENVSLKGTIEALKKEKDQVKASLDEAEKRYNQVTELLKSQQDQTNSLQKSMDDLQRSKEEAEKNVRALKEKLTAAPEIMPAKPKSDKIELDKIVVNPAPGDATRGKVLSVDKESEFLVCNLGFKRGVRAGDVLSVYRADEYLGDVKVSRVQDDLSAADLIPPFSSRKVRKNDTVIFKP